MPICYEIDIELVGIRPDGSEYPTRMPEVLRKSTPLSNEQINQEATDLFRAFVNMLSNSDPTRAGVYRMTGEVIVKTVYNC